MIAPVLEELVQDVGDTAIIAKVNIDENPETPAMLGIRSIPTLMLFKGGKMVGTKVGVQSKATLVEWIRSV
jgi:thioredoxin 1